MNAKVMKFILLLLPVSGMLDALNEFSKLNKISNQNEVELGPSYTKLEMDYAQRRLINHYSDSNSRRHPDYQDPINQPEEGDVEIDVSLLEREDDVHYLYSKRKRCETREHFFQTPKGIIKCGDEFFKEATIDRNSNRTTNEGRRTYTEYLNHRPGLMALIADKKDKILSALQDEATTYVDPLHLVEVSPTKKCAHCKSTFELENLKVVQLRKLKPNACCDATLHERCFLDYLKNDTCPNKWRHRLPHKWSQNKTNFGETLNLKQKVVLTWYNTKKLSYFVITMTLIIFSFYNFFLHTPGFFDSMKTSPASWFTSPEVVYITDYVSVFLSTFVFIWMFKIKGMVQDLVQISVWDIALPVGYGGLTGIGTAIALLLGAGLPITFALSAGLIPGLGVTGVTMLGCGKWRKWLLQFLVILPWVLSVFSQQITTGIVNMSNYTAKL